jgi:DNA-binding CsgD family transcriptional regulator
VLAAAVDIFLAVDELEAARGACAELGELTAGSESELLRAIACHARGAVELARGDAAAALGALRPALATWHELGAPYEEARSRELVGRACRLLGDDDSASLELEAARRAYADLGAVGDLARSESLLSAGLPDLHGLTAREHEVLCLVAAGKTNKEIADELVLSSRTVDRHVSNIFAKLGVSSRAAATAFAYEHRLV